MTTARSTLKHASIYSAASMLGKLVGFLMLPLYAHRLGTEGYGVIGMVDAAITLLTSLLAYGAQAAVMRIYHEQPEGRKAAAVSTGFWLVGGVSAALALPLMLASAPISSVMFGDAGLGLVFCLALLGFVLDISGQSAGTILLIRQRSVAFSLVGLLRLVIGLTLNIVLIVVLDLGVYGYFLSSALTSAASFVVLQRLSFQECGYAFDRGIARELIRFQLPLVPSAMVSFVSTQSERVILRFVESIEKVGILEMAYKFPSLIQLLIHTPLMQSWNTERIRIAQEGGQGAPRRIGDMFTTSLYFLVFGGLLIALCIGDVLVVLTPESFWDAQRIAQVECLTVVIVSATYHANFGYLFQKDSRAWALLSGWVSVLKVGLSFLFILWLGILGAAYSALLSAMLLFVLAGRGGQRRYAIRYRRKENLAICAVAAVIFLGTELASGALMRAAQASSTWLLQSVDVSALVSAGGILAKIVEKLPYMIDASFRVLIVCSALVFWPVIRRLRAEAGSAQSTH